jgi:hypothetical protein
MSTKYIQVSPEQNRGVEQVWRKRISKQGLRID